VASSFAGKANAYPKFLAVEKFPAVKTIFFLLEIFVQTYVERHSRAWKHSHVAPLGRRFL